MRKIERLISALTELSKSNLAKEFADENAELFENLNRDQMAKGLNQTGNFMPKYKDNPLNKKKNRTGEPIKLFDTGLYRSKVKSDPKNNEVVIDNTDSKNSFLQPKYDAIGLTPGSLGIVRNKFKSFGITKFRNKVNRALA